MDGCSTTSGQFYVPHGQVDRVRVVSGVIALVLGLAALLGAIGLQTVWAPPETLTATTGTAATRGAPAEAPLTVITGGINEVDDEPVEYSLTGEGDYTVMLGQTRDVEAWVGDAAHNTVTGIQTDVPRGEAPVVQVEHADGEATTPNPAGSDLWVDTQEASGTIDQRWSVPAEGDWALLVAADGTQPAPTELTVTWTNNVGNSPWIVPLYVIGSLLVLAGLVLLAWAFVARRGHHGPDGGARSGTGRRAVAQGRPGPVPRPGATGTGHARVAGAAATVLAVGAALGAAPATADTPDAAPTARDAATVDGGAFPIVTDRQLERVLERVSVSTAQGDRSRDVDAMRPRVAGQALEMRSYNYRNLAASSAVDPVDPLAASPVLSALAVSDPAFPRTIVAVTEDHANATPQILVLRQASARAQYKLVATTPMTPGAQLPAGELADTSVQAIDPDDATGLVMAPSSALGGLARHLTDAQDPAGGRFLENPYIDRVHDYQDDVEKEAPDARVSLSRQALVDATAALRLPDGSALVIGHYNARTTIAPREDGGRVVMSDLATKRAGEDDNETTSPVHMAYREVVAVRVPAEGATGNEAKVSLVGMTDEMQAVTFE
jgi:hypothetical protein